MNSKTQLPKKVYLSIVVPLYNEASSLQELHRQICNICEKTQKFFEVIYIDDGSRDGSFRVLNEIHNKDDRAKVIRFRRNCGKSEALSAGFHFSQGDMVVTMDADLQDDPEEISRLIDKIEEGFDVVSGWKKKRKDPLSKRIPSKVWNWMTSCLTRVKIHDFNCGLKIYRQEVVKNLNIYGELHRYIPALASWAGFIVTEIPVNHRSRKHGKSKYGFTRFFKGIFDLITIIFLSRFTKRPLHLFGVFGFLSAFVGTGITIYLVILRIIKATYLTNRPLLFIGLLFLIVGVQFISIGLLGEMITRSNAHQKDFTIRQTLGV